MLVARVAGVSTRDAAEALKGVEIFARRDQLPPPNEDEFYYDDLVGLEAVDAAGAPLGRVIALMNHGAGDVLEIAPVDGGETLLLPFSKERRAAHRFRRRADRHSPSIDGRPSWRPIERPREVEGQASEANGVLLRAKGADTQRRSRR